MPAGTSGRAEAATNRPVECRLVSAGQACRLWPRIRPLVSRSLARECARTGRLRHFTQPEDIYARITTGTSQLVAVLGHGWMVVDRTPIPFSAESMLYVWIVSAERRRAARRVIIEVERWLQEFARRTGCSRLGFLSERRAMERWAKPLGYVAGARWWLKDLK